MRRRRWPGCTGTRSPRSSAAWLPREDDAVTICARSLNLLHRQGYLAAPVERFIVQVRRKQDLFRVADVLAVHPQRRLFLQVQSTTAGHVSDRLARCRARPELASW